MKIFSQPSLPQFLIIGAQKAGTTTLYNCLTQHPQIAMPGEKEVHFFDLNYEKGMDWYRKKFRNRNPFRRRIAGEASPYYLFHPLVPQRVAKHLPKVKLIVLLRNPVNRAYSHFQHEIKLKTEHLTSFKAAIEMENQRIAEAGQALIEGRLQTSAPHQSFSYISRGLYARQIERWLEYFPHSQMLFLKSEDFFAHPQGELSKVYRFLEVKEIFPKVIDAQNVNHYPDLSETLRRQTAELFREDTQRLASLLGEKFRWK
jgi:hypothetical protein